MIWNKYNSTLSASFVRFTINIVFKLNLIRKHSYAISNECFKVELTATEYIIWRNFVTIDFTYIPLIIAIYIVYMIDNY